MTRRRSMRELEAAIEEMDLRPVNPDEPCEECGGLPEGADIKTGITAAFVTTECTCDEELPDGCWRVTFEDGEMVVS